MRLDPVMRSDKKLLRDFPRGLFPRTDAVSDLYDWKEPLCLCNDNRINLPMQYEISHRETDGRRHAALWLKLFSALISTERQGQPITSARVRTWGGERNSVQPLHHLPSPRWRRCPQPCELITSLHSAFAHSRCKQLTLTHDW